MDVLAVYPELQKWYSSSSVLRLSNTDNNYGMAMEVDVHKPDVLLRVEIRKLVNIYSLMIPGPGGMPVGTNGKAMLLLSGGIDSPVAGYMIAKRGKDRCGLFSCAALYQ